MKVLIINIHLIFIFSIVFTISISSQAQTLYWQSITEDIYVYDILFDGEQNLYFSGSAGNFYFWRSTDLGNTWTQHSSGLNGNGIYRFDIDSSGILWGGVAYGSGGIYKSTNSGTNWSRSLSSSDNIFSITVSPNNWIWAGTDEGKVFYSSNSGENWDEIVLSSGIIWSIAANKINYVFVGNDEGEIYRSTNLGSSWELVYNSTEWLIIRGIVVDSSNYIYANAYGQSKRLLSTDNGNSWLEILGPNLESLYISAYHNFFGGSGSSGYRSLDSCLSWQSIGPPWPNDPNAFTFVDSLIFVGTAHGVFMHDPAFQPYVADNYFPLNVGNIWQFNNRCNGDFAGNNTYFIEKDTIIQNKRYFFLEGSVNDLVLYNEEENIFYLRWNDSNYVVMNFTLNEGSLFQRILFNTHQLVNVQVVSPTYINIFDSSYHSKGSFWGTSGPPAQAHTTYYSENLGETLIHSYYDNIGGGAAYCDRKMIRAIINDSTGIIYYSDHVKPIIDFQPVFVTNKFNLNWDFSVDHYYSHFDQNYDVNYIDSVLLLSYYSDGDTTILYDSLAALNEPSSINYSISFLLDSMLMNNDYKFYYKIYAIDKGVVPEYSTKPDTGYYELVYDTSTVSIVEINRIISTYSLEQNYPNPFNPTTTIKYQIPEISFVTIKVYDVLGNEITTLVNEEKPTGSYKVEFNGNELTSGIYFYRLQASTFVETKKMVLLR